MEKFFLSQFFATDSLPFIIFVCYTFSKMKIDLGSWMRMKREKLMSYFTRILGGTVIFLTANLPLLRGGFAAPSLIFLIVPCFLILNVFPCFYSRRLTLRKLRVCADGCELLIQFLLSVVGTIVFLLAMIPKQFPAGPWLWFGDLLCAVLVEAVVFWNGILRVYAASAQLRMKWRVIGILCGWIPVANLIVLGKIIRIAMEETTFESEKIFLNKRRKDAALCRTKYPILMVHGVFFRDFKYFNYWGRIPKELEENGAVLYYGNHQSAASIADCAEELSGRIEGIIKETGCEKVNIIAHSKGGLDSRYAISRLGMERYVASLTTINTPHRGCVFADYLLNTIPEAVKEKTAQGYNTALKKLGDKSPDFLAAVSGLTASACSSFNEETPDSSGVFYQSVGSRLNAASDGQFPLNFSHQLVKYFDGPNDGLVAEKSFQWGDGYTFLTTEGKRGISHGDMIDLNRENIPGFDVREFYVQLVSRLREQGY